jgi:hypothetical protein
MSGHPVTGVGPGLAMCGHPGAGSCRRGKPLFGCRVTGRAEREAGCGSRATGSNCDYDPKPQHRLCDFNAGLPKKSHVWEEANTKNQTKPYLRPSSAPWRAGSSNLTKSCSVRYDQ